MVKRQKVITVRKGYLKLRRVSMLTVDRYSKSAIGFLTRRRLAVPEDLSSLKPECIDDHEVEADIEWLYEAGYESHVGTYLVAALNFFCNVPRALSPWPNARGALSGWKNLEPSISTMPCPWIVATHIAWRLMMKKDPVAAQAARLWLVSFDAYSRSCEILDVKTHNCFLPNVGGSTVFAFTLSSSLDFEMQTNAGRPLRTKTKATDDTIVIDKQSFPGIGLIFRQLVCAAKAANADTLSFMLTYPAYATLITSAAVEANIPFKVTPHLARHGGASEDFFRRKRSLDEIMKRGRWRDKRSVTRYEKSGMLLKALSSLSPQTRAECERTHALNLRFMAE